MKYGITAVLVLLTTVSAHPASEKVPAYWLTQSIDACTAMPTIETISAIRVELASFQEAQAQADHDIAKSNSDIEGLRKWRESLASKIRYLTLMEALVTGQMVDYEHHLQWLVQHLASGQRIEERLPLTDIYYAASIYGASRPSGKAVADEISEYQSSLSGGSTFSAVDGSLLATVQVLVEADKDPLDSKPDEWVQLLAKINVSENHGNAAGLKDQLFLLDNVDTGMNKLAEVNTCTSPLVGALRLRLATEVFDILEQMAGAKPPKPVLNEYQRRERLITLVDRAIGELPAVHYPELSSKAYLMLSTLYQARSDESSSGPVSDIYLEMSEKAKEISHALSLL